MPLTNIKSFYQIAGTLATLVCSLSISAQVSADEGFSMKIMDVFAITGRGTVLTGQIATGSIVVGDPVCIPLTSGETAARKVDGIEMFRKILESAEKGQMVGLLVEVDKKLVVKGAVMHSDCELEGGSD